jgi:hypothetical protein
MATWGGNYPFGLRQIALYSSDGTGKVLLPTALMLHVTPLLETARFEADGHLVGAASFVAGAEWELEAGGISLEALAKLTGGNAVSVGSTPNRTLTLSEDAGLHMPYVRIAGRAVAADGGDIIARLYRCKLEALEGTFRDGEFWVSYAKGVAVTNGSVVYEFVQQETVAAL